VRSDWLFLVGLIDTAERLFRIEFFSELAITVGS